MLPQLMGKGQS
jgi:hypothetical protein